MNQDKDWVYISTYTRMYQTKEKVNSANNVMRSLREEK